jgi:hypothetical protein
MLIMAVHSGSPTAKIGHARFSRSCCPDPQKTTPQEVVSDRLVWLHTRCTSASRCLAMTCDVPRPVPATIATDSFRLVPFVCSVPPCEKPAQSAQWLRRAQCLPGIRVAGSCFRTGPRLDLLDHMAVPEIVIVKYVLLEKEKRGAQITLPLSSMSVNSS